MKKNIVIVGGGIAGILCARMLAKEHNVTIIEKENSIGGLLRSYSNDGLWFDTGTHLLAETGIDELDDLIFGERSQEKYRFFNYLKAGHYFKTLNENYFIDIRKIESEYYSKACEELLSKVDSGNATNLEEQLTSQFGHTLTSKVFSPVLFNFFNTNLKDLSVDSHITFGLKRIVAFDPEKTRELKKTPHLDNKLGFHSYTEGMPAGKVFYPKESGVGNWIQFLERELKEDSVLSLLNESIAEVNSLEKKVTSVKLSSGIELPCDHLVWTAPSFLLSRAANISVNKKMTPPKKVQTVVFDFIIDQPYLSDLFYFYCFDPDLKTFRVTLYNNFNGAQGRADYGITCEVLLSSDMKMEDLEKEVFKELELMGVITKTTVKKKSKTRIVAGGFPVPTVELSKQNQYMNSLILDKYENVSLLGKASGKTFFMSDVLIEAYNSVKNTLKEGSDSNV